jgi:hypothetical protein
MGYWASISLGMAMAAKIAMIVEKYKYLPKKQVIAKCVAKLNKTLDEMVIE